MIDLQHIREQYAAMSNEELQALLLQPDSLRRDAYMILKTECRKRGIDKQLLQDADDTVAGNNIDRIKANLSKAEKQRWAELQRLAFEQRYQHENDDAVLIEIIGKGATAEEGNWLIENLSKLAAANLKDAEASIISGLIKGVCGIAIIVIAYMANLGYTPVIWGALLGGIGFMEGVNGQWRKNRYTTILANTPEVSAPSLPQVEGDIDFEEIL